MSLEYPASGERQVRPEPVLAQSSGHVDDDIHISAVDASCEMDGRERRYIKELHELVESMTCLNALEEKSWTINQNVVTDQKINHNVVTVSIVGKFCKVPRRSRWMRNS